MAIITNHAKRRIQSRRGITKKFSNKYINRVMTEGIRPEDTLDKLQLLMSNKKYMSDTHHDKDNPYNTIFRYYAGAIYVFKGSTLGTKVLVTVLNVEDDEINRNLHKYVTKDVYTRYKYHREKWAKKGKKQEQKKKESLNDQYEANYLAIVRQYVEEHNYPLLISSVHLKDTELKIHYCSDSDISDWKQYEDICFYIWRNHKLHVLLIKLKNLDGTYITIDEYKKLHS